MPKCLVTHYTDKETNRLMWACPKGLTSTSHIATATKCWRYNCPGIRELPLNLRCAHEGCDSLANGSEKAKYCSKQCKSKESSRRYRMKKKNEQESTDQ
jgi:hypothetical protein